MYNVHTHVPTDIQFIHQHVHQQMCEIIDVISETNITITKITCPYIFCCLKYIKCTIKTNPQKGRRISKNDFVYANKIKPWNPHPPDFTIIYKLRYTSAMITFSFAVSITNLLVPSKTANDEELSNLPRWIMKWYM